MLFGANINHIIDLYWEADRSAIKARYDELFAPAQNLSDIVRENSEPNIAPISGGSKPSALEVELERDITAYLTRMQLPEQLCGEIRRYWNVFDTRTRSVCMHYLYGLALPAMRLQLHSLEGLMHLQNVDIASHLGHIIDPTLFPVGEHFTNVSYLQFRKILDVFGIEFDDSKELSSLDVLLNLSDAIESYRIEHTLEHWQIWSLIYDLGPRLIESEGPYPADPPPKVWIVATNDSLGEFATIDTHSSDNVGTWAINPRAKRGDLALMYCVAPRSAFTAVYRCATDAFRDPFGGWNHHRGEITDRIEIPWITFKDLKADAVIQGWRLVKSNRSQCQNDICRDRGIA